MTKFKENLVKSNSDIKEMRADALALQAERAKRRIVEKLEDDIIDIDTKVSRLNDLSPRNKTDLAYREDFDSEAWANETQELLEKKSVLEIKLKIAKESYEEWFGGKEKK
jgi:hypothetical protein